MTEPTVDLAEFNQLKLIIQQYELCFQAQQNSLEQLACTAHQQAQQIQELCQALTENSGPVPTLPATPLSTAPAAFCLQDPKRSEE